MLRSCTRLVLLNLCQQCFDGLLLFWICFSFQKQIVTKTYDNHWRRHNVCWAKRVQEVHQTIAVLSAVIWITCFFLILYFSDMFNILYHCAEAAAGGVLQRKVCLEILENSQKPTCARVSFLVKLRVLRLLHTSGRLLLTVILRSLQVPW